MKKAIISATAAIAACCLGHEANAASNTVYYVNVAGDTGMGQNHQDNGSDSSFSLEVVDLGGRGILASPNTSIGTAVKTIHMGAAGGRGCISYKMAWMTTTCMTVRRTGKETFVVNYDERVHTEGGETRNMASLIIEGDGSNCTVQVNSASRKFWNTPGMYSENIVERSCNVRR